MRIVGYGDIWLYGRRVMGPVDVRDGETPMVVVGRVAQSVTAAARAWGEDGRFGREVLPKYAALLKALA